MGRKIEFKEIKDAIKHIQTSAFDDAESWKKFKQWLDQNDYVTVFEASRQLKVWYQTIRAVLKTSSINTRCKKYNGRTYVVIKFSDLPRLMQECDEYKRHKRAWR